LDDATHRIGKPILVSDYGKSLLYNTGIFPENIVVYDAESKDIEDFISRSTSLLIEGVREYGRMRKTG
jgi:hypothetical protein